MTDQPQPEATAPPLLRVVNPDATPEQIAAILTVLTTLNDPTPPPPPTPRSLWARPQPRTPHHPGPHAWRTSSLPH